MSTRPAYLVTGSSGFVGSHVCDAAPECVTGPLSVYGLDIAPPRYPGPHRHVAADIRYPATFDAFPVRDVNAIIHLAARAELITPFAEMHDLIDRNTTGTANVLNGFRTPTFVLASSGAVYGHSGSAPVRNDFERIRPEGTYGVSKVFSEYVAMEWARERRGAAVAFRFGNVIGSRCRGFLPYLVNHALDHPDGRVVAHCRGGGQIPRDYFPVDYLARLLWAAAVKTWEPGSYQVFNAGTGGSMTNGEVAEVVTAVLAKLGYRLNINWNTPLIPGESNCIVMDVDETTRVFNIPPPCRADVVAAIEAGVLSSVAARQPMDAVAF